MNEQIRTMATDLRAFLNEKLSSLFVSQSSVEAHENRIPNIQAELSRIQQQINRVSNDIDRIDAGQLTNPIVSPVAVERLRDATERLHRFNQVGGAIKELLNIVLEIVEAGAGARAPAGTGADLLPRGTVAGIAAASLLPQAPPPRALFEFGREAAAPPAPLTAGRAADRRPSLRAGRYRGGTVQMAVDLRIDLDAGVISADLWRLDTAGQRTWVASLRSAPGAALAGAIAVFAEDRWAARSSGRIDLTPAGTAGAAVHCVLLFDRPLDGLPFGREIAFTCERIGDGLRELGLELELEDAVPPPPQVTDAGRTMSIEQALADAGIEVIRAGEQSRLPQAPAGGWSEKHLEELMVDFAQNDLSRRDFITHVLWLSQSNRGGLLGVMFDTDDELPRQGLAVFAKTIRDAYAGRPEHRDRKLIQTAVHEIGHALNLAHCFEREVGRADSTSFMNYDWR
ncbi:MAG TPA: hypothetical protein VES39_12685, partial [Rhodospirillales bacterium]|nr:hypothetical protein [Rhodospirillales bacterium]